MTVILVQFEASSAWMSDTGTASISTTALSRIIEESKEPDMVQWLCYRILAQECWPILAHPRPSTYGRPDGSGGLCGLESQSGFVRATPS